MNRAGYKVVSVGIGGHPNADRFGKIREHTLVLSNYIGRPLRKGEQVHHKNGIKTDNRIENLELKSGPHGSGQSIPDQIAWAKEILLTYFTENKLSEWAEENKCYAKGLAIA